MKKNYLLLLTALIGILVISFYIIQSKFDQSSSEKILSSKQKYDFEYEYMKNEVIGKAGKPNEYTKYFKAITTKFGENKDNYPINYRFNEFEGAQKRLKRQTTNTKSTTITWTSRGPANVGGRTRGLIVDPEDTTNNTWFAGSATGGVWKTTNGGQSWECLTDTLPNLSANTLAMANSNYNVIYAGTGESFPGGANLQGSGIFKSTDKGNTWEQLENTVSNDFRFVNRLIVDPNDENIVLAATEAGIMKSIDGGISWNKVYSTPRGVEDLDADPTNFDKLYGTENSVGVILSTDAGENWTISNDGIEQGSRYELAISKENPDKIYVSINNTVPSVYRSIDGGISWEKFRTKDELYDFLGGQGNYDNTIEVHPYDEDIVFVGGVSLYKVDFSNPGTLNVTDTTVYGVNLINTDSFLDFINFGGGYLNGGMETGDENGATNLSDEDFISIEIRFGPGLKQKAHRFTVPTTSGTNADGGAGVAASEYQYQDYVEVPFEVWDITNDIQIMASFRDQERDRKFNLIERILNDDVSGREYLFVNAVPYDENSPSSQIAKDAGHSYKQLYFFWPTLANDKTWDDSNLPDSKISIKYGIINSRSGKNSIVADAYGDINAYEQGTGFGTTSIPGLHPDHHNLIMIKTDTVEEKFTILNANDGGVAISEDEGTSFKQLPRDYVTSQFYGVAKRPDVGQYIGGTQDNGTWSSPPNKEADSESFYYFRIGGDGFECAWNREHDSLLMGSIYYNAFQKSTDGGNTWNRSVTGIENVKPFDGEMQLDGPFISRLSSHPSNPDLLFAVGYNGIYKSVNFGDSWRKIIIDEGWNTDYYIENEFATSQHNIEPSLANENIVWAGAAMNSGSGLSILVSTNRGESFTPVSDYTENDVSGFISGIATHPTKDSTAYVLFSFANEPKVLRTNDLGNTWEDISGFNGSSTSSNGFPNVVTHSLVVMPHDPSILWVGTDIGIFESTDNGSSWHYLESDLPAVSVYDMFIQDGQVVIATHGRGIWTADIEEIKSLPELYPIQKEEDILSTTAEYNIAYDSVRFIVNDEYVETFINPSTGFNTIEYTFSDEKDYEFYVLAYQNGEKYRSNNVRKSLNTTGMRTAKKVIHELKVYPNPSRGEVTVELPSELDKNYPLQVYSLSGSMVYSTQINKGDNRINMNNLNNGLYIIRIEHDGEIYSQKIQIRK